LSERAAAVLDRVPADWEAVVAGDPGSSPSHRAAVWEALAATVPGFEWRLLVHHEDGLLAGGAPVILSRRGPFHWLHALPWLLPAAPLARPGAHARVELALCDAFAGLARERGVVGGTWSFYRPEGPRPAEGALARVPGETRWIEAALVRLAGGPEAARAGVHRKQRQALEHARARGYVFAEEAGALDEAYALHLAQSRRWPGHRPLPLELSRRLLAASSAAAGPVARLFTLRSPLGLVSATLALDGPHETFAWWSGTHAEGRRTQAFALLLWSAIEWAAAHGRRRFNLGASSGLGAVASFKHALGAERFEYPVRWLDARAAGWAGRAVVALQARVRGSRSAAPEGRAAPGGRAAPEGHAAPEGRAAPAGRAATGAEPKARP
jgi:hypothetical protein